MVVINVDTTAATPAGTITESITLDKVKSIVVLPVSIRKYLPAARDPDFAQNTTTPIPRRANAADNPPTSAAFSAAAVPARARAAIPSKITANRNIANAT